MEVKLVTMWTKRLSEKLVWRLTVQFYKHVFETDIKPGSTNIFHYSHEERYTNTSHFQNFMDLYLQKSKTILHFHYKLYKLYK